MSVSALNVWLVTGMSLSVENKKLEEGRQEEYAGNNGRIINSVKRRIIGNVRMKVLKC